MNRDEYFTTIIRSRLSAKRFEHSMNVAETARQLAEKFGADPEKAYTAGILHDSCKDLPKSEQLSYLVLNDIPLSVCELAAPKIFHARCGRLFAERELGVTDEDILNAIRYHTTGRANMSVLEKVIFIADFISAERNYDGVEIMREKAAESLEEAIFEGLSFTIKDLINDEKAVHTDTVDAYNDALIYLKKQQGELK